MKEAVVRFTCDRCRSVIAENQGNGLSEDEPREGPHLRITGELLGKAKGGDHESPIEFADLCEKCEARIVSLIEAIMKTGKGKKKKAKVVKKKNSRKPPANDPDFSDIPAA